MHHSFEAHSISPNFIFTCGVHGCPQTFSNIFGMMSHLGRKHRGVDLDNAQELPDFLPSTRDEQEVVLDEGINLVDNAQELPDF